MKLAVRHTALGVDDLEDAFQRAAELGVDGIEIVYDYVRDAKEMGKPEHVKEVASLSENYGVAVAGIDLRFLTARPSLIDADRLARAQDAVRAALSTAAAVGARVVLVPFFAKNVIETEAELQTAGDALLDLVDFAASAGAVLAIESTLNLHQCLFLLDYLGNTSDVGVYFNTGVALARKYDVATMLRDLGRERLAQVHLQDVRLQPGQPPDFSICLGEGNVDFRAVAQSLQAIQFDGWIVPQPPPGRDPLAATEADLVFARGLVAM